MIFINCLFFPYSQSPKDKRHSFFQNGNEFRSTHSQIGDSTNLARAFGASSGESGSEDYRYTGKHEDTTGLYYFGARSYDPLTGRFTTKDTVFGELGDHQSQNRYAYCMNNPQKYVDPDGKWALKIGYGGSAGYVFGGISSTLGVAYGSDHSGEQTRVEYTEIGTGPQLGAGASTSPEIAFSLFGDVEDVGGDSFTVGADASFIITGLGLGVSVPINEDNTLAWSKFFIVVNPPILSYGISAKIYARPSHTEIYYLGESNSETGSEIEESTSIYIPYNDEALP